MTRRTIFLLTMMIGLFSASPVDAIVYVLRKGYSIKDVRGLLKAKSVLKDKVTINGTDGEMEVFLSSMKMSDALAALKHALKENKSSLGKGTVVIDVSDGKWINRLLVLKAGTKSKVVLFHMRLPANDAGDDPDRAWPGDLPKPSGARIGRVIKLKKSGAAFCQFSGEGDRSFFHSYDQTLKGSGWAALSTEGDHGAAYLNEKKDQMLVFSTWKEGETSYGSVFLRNIKSLPLK